MPIELLPQLCLDPWFSGQPLKFQTALAERGRVVRRRNKQFIFAAGDPADGVYAILSGSVHMIHLTPGGSCSIYYVKQAPAWFGELSELDGQPRAQDAIADGSVTLLHLPHTTLQSLLAERPEFWACFAQLMAYRTRDLFEIIETVVTRPARVRLAGVLLNFQRRDRGDPEPFVPARITQDILARMIGSTRQTVSRILGEFERENWITVRYRGIAILSRSGLLKIASSHVAPGRVSPL
jgi:CRP-like cAMP-binding protein